MVDGDLKWEDYTYGKGDYTLGLKTIQSPFSWSWNNRSLLEKHALYRYLQLSRGKMVPLDRPPTLALLAISPCYLSRSLLHKRTLTCTCCHAHSHWLHTRLLSFCLPQTHTHEHCLLRTRAHTESLTAFLSLFLTHMHRESGQRYMPSRSHLTSEGQQVSTIPVRCGQCNYPSATALTIIRHGKIALSITKQASVAHIAGLSLIDLFLYLAGPQIRSLSFFLSLWASYTHTQPLCLVRGLCYP